MYPVIEQLDNDELQRRVVGFLDSRGISGVGGLQVTVADGMVVVKGCLPSPYDQRLCVEGCRHVPGVVGVVDRTRISRAAPAQERARAPRPR
jgi:hypothetical protein